MPVPITDSALSTPTRQSPLAIVAIVAKQARAAVRSFGFVAVIAAIRGGNLILLIPLAVVGLVVVRSIGAWWTTTIELSGNELVLRKGLITRQRTAIPLDKIQAVEADQGVMQRIFGLYRVRVDSAGSAMSEIDLDAVTTDVVATLRRIATEHHTTIEHLETDDEDSALISDQTAGLPGPTDAPEQIVLRHGIADLIQISLAKNPLRPIALGAAALLSVLQGLDDLVDIDVAGIRDQVFGGATTLALVAALITAMLLTMAASVIGTIIRDHDLTLRWTGNGFRLASGLLERRERVASIDRIQSVHWRRNPIERRLGISTMRIPQASAGAETAASLRIPGVRDADREQILGRYLPRESVPAADRSLADAAIGRWILWFGVVPTIVAVAGGYLVIGTWALLATIWIPLMVALARRTHQRWHWGVGPDAITVSHGAFTTQDAVVALHKAQTTRLVENWWHRRRGLATIRISTAGGKIVIPHVRRDEAIAVIEQALAIVETSDRPWM